MRLAAIDNDSVQESVSARRESARRERDQAAERALIEVALDDAVVRAPDDELDAAPWITLHRYRDLDEAACLGLARGNLLAPLATDPHTAESRS